ncbi:hypothetical protein H9657_06815 [Cellulomonas sp. Sa3CUA2]|uniref:Abi-like protein n=1 Tax=Cellulomonas avistercoris TaxID=2762242 RepID=A0ABR8QC40_9CELL|nr:hypothetical protein [Cellulomonas avistercoris]MBD7917989.1 hypothetical protein [Cellulomonas avistercoris]
MPHATSHDPVAICRTLSRARSATYLRAAAQDQAAAVDLYGWNARVSAALILPAHFAEVSVRNAVDDALSSVYGERWPWSDGFYRTLPAPGGRVYKPRDDLAANRARYGTTGKVVADLKFVFWQTMFTARHDGRLWSRNIVRSFPNAGQIDPKALRGRIYDDLEVVRRLRNRLAHHEPVFARDLADDLRRMLELVDLRCTATGVWLRDMEDVTALLRRRP